MNENRARLDENSRIEIEVGHVENGGTFLYDYVVRKPAGEIIVADRLDKTVHVGFSDILFVEVVHRDFGIVRKNHAGYDFIAYSERLARAVFRDVFTHFNDFARTLVT